MGYEKYNHWLPRLIKWWKNYPCGKGNDWAITLGQTAYYSCGPDKINDWWRAHEDYHKYQWIREGYIKYFFQYIWYLWKYGYENHPWEIEANNAADRAINAKAD